MISHPYRRIATVLATAAGACAIAVPAAAGLSNNATFSEHIPVPAPTAAHRVSFDDHGRAREAHEHHVRRNHPEPGDDHDRRTQHREAGDDHGRRHQAEPGDDHGRRHHAEPGDDHGRGRR